MKDLLEMTEEIMGLFRQIENGTMQEALLCTMFDIMCESHGMDKAKTIDEMARIIKQVNEELGDMHDAKDHV